MSRRGAPHNWGLTAAWIGMAAIVVVGFIMQQHQACRMAQNTRTVIRELLVLPEPGTTSAEHRERIEGLGPYLDFLAAPPEECAPHWYQPSTWGSSAQQR